MKSWLQDNLIEIYSTRNEVKSAVAERFIRTLKKTIYKHMTSISIYKHAYIYTYIYIYIYTNFARLFVCQLCMPLSKYKNIFAKDYTSNWSEEAFVISGTKNTVPRTYVISDLSSEEIVGIFFENERQKTNQKEFRIEEVIQKKGSKLYAKWRGYDNSFNSWISKKNVA